MTNDFYYQTTQKLLSVYRERLAVCPDNRFYKARVNELEAEVATMDIMKEKKLINYQEFMTNSLSAVIDIIRDHSLSIVELDTRWSWNHFRWMYYVKYFVI